MKQKLLQNATVTVLLCLFSFSSVANIIYVDSAATGLNNGSSWVNAYTDFAAGIAVSSSGDSVFVSKGTYQPSNGTSFSMKEGVKIYGGFAGSGSTFASRDWLTNVTILKGNGNSVIRNVNITSAAMIDGFTITGGSACSGGGISNNSSSPVIQHCIFTGNIAKGAYFAGCGFGGAIDNLLNCSPLITDCRFLQNTATIGNAITSNRSSPVISNCTFSNNRSPIGTGGISIENEFSSSSNIPLTIINCTFSGNGGGVGNYSAPITIAGCIFSGNSGLAVSTGGETKIINCTISGNKSGVYVGFANVNTLIQNCVFYGNASEITHSSDDTGRTIVNNSVMQNAYTGTGTGNKIADPLLADAPSYNNASFTGGDYHFQPGSPAIDAGNNDSIPPGLNTDIDGNPRIQNGIVDMGAYEYSSVLPVKLSSFTVNNEGKRIKLAWSTASEENNDYFNVLRSTDGQTWQVINKVNSKSASPGTANYAVYDDSSPLNVFVYYRLQQYDKDGKYMFSNIRVVKIFFAKKAGTSVLPNLVTSDMNFKLENTSVKDVQAILTDVTGRIVYKQTFKNIQADNLSGLNLKQHPAPGIYILKLKGDGLSESIKVVVQ